MAPDDPDDKVALFKAKLSFVVVLAGLGLALGFYWIAVERYGSASNATAVMAPALGVIGTIVGAYFGIQTGSAGKERVEAQKTRAENQRANLMTLSSKAVAVWEADRARGASRIDPYMTELKNATDAIQAEILPVRPAQSSPSGGTS